MCPGIGQGDAAVKSTESYICPETLVLFTICLLDMLSSALLFQHGQAVEANPILRHSAEAGMLPFMSAKMLTFLPALAVAEWYRRRRPAFVVPLLRWTAICYVAVYAVMVGGQFLG